MSIDGQIFSTAPHLLVFLLFDAIEWAVMQKCCLCYSFTYKCLTLVIMALVG
jgi:hypothetical protein